MRRRKGHGEGDKTGCRGGSAVSARSLLEIRNVIKVSLSPERHVSILFFHSALSLSLFLFLSPFLRLSDFPPLRSPPRCTLLTSAFFTRLEKALCYFFLSFPRSPPASFFPRLSPFYFVRSVVPVPRLLAVSLPLLPLFALRTIPFQRLF